MLAGMRVKCFPILCGTKQYVILIPYFKKERVLIVFRFEKKYQTLRASVYVFVQDDVYECTVCGQLPLINWEIRKSLHPTAY